MTVRFFNTLSQSLEPFEPSDPHQARLLLANPSRKERHHLAQARTSALFDVLSRHLGARGFDVTHARRGGEGEDAIDLVFASHDGGGGDRGAPMKLEVGAVVAHPAEKELPSLDDLAARNDPEALRWFLLGEHYRAPLSVLLEATAHGSPLLPALDEAERRVEYLYNTRQALIAAAAGKEPAVGNVLQGQAKTIDEAPIHVLAALDKDLGTPQALAAIVEMAKAANDVVIQIAKLKNKKAAQDSARRLAARAVQALDGACAPLGVMQANGEAFAARTRERRLKIRNLDAGVVEAKVQARVQARTAHDFPRADALRKELTEMGIEVLDSGTASSWRVVL